MSPRMCKRTHGAEQLRLQVQLNTMTEWIRQS